MASKGASRKARQFTHFLHKVFVVTIVLDAGDGKSKVLSEPGHGVIPQITLGRRIAHPRIERNEFSIVVFTFHDALRMGIKNNAPFLNEKRSIKLLWHWRDQDSVGQKRPKTNNQSARRQQILVWLLWPSTPQAAMAQLVK